ncbi:MAG: hypothetical protein BWY04_01375 [candidate division CPR1 bacterium ADurb.Bin160]|uniref:Uncharacterized protein n=1 Tax=candidate division CPR1 bacterium ADurb.Bin160 TaxID=1852826 RepID=A0A1V5ZJF2_9BACT|nr:MAG: hypothetical protein BWY04_01375 [candidate division CPR1 bacterium ADurb.Bin160]
MVDKYDVKEAVEAGKVIYKKSTNLETNIGDSTLKCKIKPKKDKTKIALEWNKSFIEDDVEITVKVNGNVNCFNSPKGSDIIQSATFCATKKF